MHVFIICSQNSLIFDEIKDFYEIKVQKSHSLHYSMDERNSFGSTDNMQMVLPMEIEDGCQTPSSSSLVNELSMNWIPITLLEYMYTEVFTGG